MIQRFLRDWVALLSQYTTLLINGHRPFGDRLRARIKYTHMMSMQGYSPRITASFTRPWVLAIMVCVCAKSL